MIAAYRSNRRHLNTIFHHLHRMNDIEKATNAKFQVEQKQREEAKERKDALGEWETKVMSTLRQSKRVML